VEHRFLAGRCGISEIKVGLVAGDDLRRVAALEAPRRELRPGLRLDKPQLLDFVPFTCHTQRETAVNDGYFIPSGCALSLLLRSPGDTSMDRD